MSTPSRRQFVGRLGAGALAISIVPHRCFGQPAVPEIPMAAAKDLLRNITMQRTSTDAKSALNTIRAVASAARKEIPNIHSLNVPTSAKELHQLAKDLAKTAEGGMGSVVDEAKKVLGGSLPTTDFKKVSTDLLALTGLSEERSALFGRIGYLQQTLSGTLDHAVERALGNTDFKKLITSATGFGEKFNGLNLLSEGVRIPDLLKAGSGALQRVGDFVGSIDKLDGKKLLDSLGQEMLGKLPGWAKDENGLKSLGDIGKHLWDTHVASLEAKDLIGIAATVLPLLKVPEGTTKKLVSIAKLAFSLSSTSFSPINALSAFKAFGFGGSDNAEVLAAIKELKQMLQEVLGRLERIEFRQEQMLKLLSEIYRGQTLILAELQSSHASLTSHLIGIEDTIAQQVFNDYERAARTALISLANNNDAQVTSFVTRAEGFCTADTVLPVMHEPSDSLRQAAEHLLNRSAPTEDLPKPLMSPVDRHSPGIVNAVGSAARAVNPTAWSRGVDVFVKHVMALDSAGKFSLSSSRAKELYLPAIEQIIKAGQESAENYNRFTENGFSQTAANQLEQQYINNRAIWKKFAETIEAACADFVPADGDKDKREFPSMGNAKVIKNILEDKSQQKIYYRESKDRWVNPSRDLISEAQRWRPRGGGRGVILNLSSRDVANVTFGHASNRNLTFTLQVFRFSVNGLTGDDGLSESYRLVKIDRKKGERLEYALVDLVGPTDKLNDLAKIETANQFNPVANQVRNIYDDGPDAVIKNVYNIVPMERLVAKVQQAMQLRWHDLLGRSIASAFDEKLKGVGEIVPFITDTLKANLILAVHYWRLGYYGANEVPFPIGNRGDLPFTRSEFAKYAAEIVTHLTLSGRPGSVPNAAIASTADAPPYLRRVTADTLPTVVSNGLKAAYTSRLTDFRGRFSEKLPSTSIPPVEIGLAKLAGLKELINTAEA